MVYELSAHHLSDLPPPGAPEIAFAGRSNSGKSSAINALAGRTRLAFVSKTPGRTQQINFFKMLRGGYLVDLPGYGYAKVPIDLRNHWNRTLATYLGERKSLAGLVIIMDARHPLTELDQKMLEWFRPTGRPIHVLLSKSDKLSRRDANASLAEVQKTLAAIGPLYSAQLFSSLKRTGMAQAAGVLAPWLGPEPEAASPAAPIAA